jgi:hypothetical protein
MTNTKVRADFNGLFGDLLCLSHSDTCIDESGNEVHLAEGMIITAFDHDSNSNGEKDDLLASGTVGRSPDWLQCNGSRWTLKIDKRGVRHEFDG